jgi:sulfhydrogenase subunit delta
VVDRARPRIGVFKFASCDGCQLTVLDCEDELLPLAERVEFADFREASSAVSEGPFDLALVEGSVTTAHDVERIHAIRANSRVLVTIGACATSGGIQALRNFVPAFEAFRQAVYARPEYVAGLATSTAIREHVPVDAELRGCPISKGQLLELISAFLGGRPPNLPTESVCAECKRRGQVCVVVAHGTPCLGPVTQTGCGAICPSVHRGCYGCFGPQDHPNLPSLIESLEAHGMDRDARLRVLRTFNAGHPVFRDASRTQEPSGGVA